MVVGIAILHHLHTLLPAIYEELSRWGPDSYITEMAENRVELSTMHKDISPSPDQYARAVDFLAGQMQKRRSRHPVARLVESLRLEYYELCKRYTVERAQIIPCYAGWASAHLAPDGNVWGTAPHLVGTPGDV